jgi:hypothetical protein
MVDVDVQRRFFMVHSTGLTTFRAFRNPKGVLFGPCSVLFGPTQDRPQVSTETTSPRQLWTQRQQRAEGRPGGARAFRSTRLTQTAPIQHRRRKSSPSHVPPPHDPPTVASDAPLQL